VGLHAEHPEIIGVEHHAAGPGTTRSPAEGQDNQAVAGPRNHLRPPIAKAVGGFVFLGSVVPARVSGLVAASIRGSYTSGMKTAISLPDAIFRDAERLAKRLKKSRSKLYVEAVAEYLARHEPEVVTEVLDQVAGKLDTRPDELTAAAARRVLERAEW